MCQCLTVEYVVQCRIVCARYTNQNTCINRRLNMSEGVKNITLFCKSCNFNVGGMDIRSLEIQIHKPMICDVRYHGSDPKDLKLSSSRNVDVRCPTMFKGGVLKLSSSILEHYTNYEKNISPFNQQKNICENSRILIQIGRKRGRWK